MDQHNPYAAPQVPLIDEQVPQALPGWSPGLLRVLGWLCLGGLLGNLVLFGLAFDGQSLDSLFYDGLSLTLSLLGCYLLLRFKGFAEIRFAAHGLDWPVWLNLVLSLALEALQLSVAEESLTGFTWQALLYFGGMALFGLLTLWLGVLLLRVENVYPAFRALAWLEIVAGVLLASVILLLVGILPLLGAMLAMALVFFRGARELEGCQAG
jgi:hypothetical protein